MEWGKTLILANKSAEALVAEYCGAFELYPLWIIGHSTRGGGYWVGHGPGYERRAKSLRASTGNAWNEARIFWCERREGATMVADCFAGRTRSLIAIADAESIVRDVAKDFGVFLHTSDSLQEDAIKVIAAVDAQLKAMHDAGELQSVNRSYREYRMKKTELHEPFVGYVTWMRDYRASLVRTAAQIMRTQNRELKNNTVT